LLDTHRHSLRRIGRPAQYQEGGGSVLGSSRA
jgi:hypothetical protein